MPQKLPVNNFDIGKKFRKIQRTTIKNYNENSNKGYILEVDDECPEYLHKQHSDLSFIHEKINIKKAEKLIRNLEKIRHTYKSFKISITSWSSIKENRQSD